MFRPIAVGNRLTAPCGQKVLGNLKQCVPKEIYFQRNNMKCSGENVLLRGIFHVVSCFPLHFMLYRGNLDCFSNSVQSLCVFYQYTFINKFGLLLLYIFCAPFYVYQYTFVHGFVSIITSFVHRLFPLSTPFCIALCISVHPCILYTLQLLQAIVTYICSYLGMYCICS